MNQICLWILALLLVFPFGEGHAQTRAAYEVYQQERLLKRFEEKMAAITYAKKWDHSSVRVNGSWIWNNYPYQIFQYDKKIKEIAHYDQAVAFAKRWDHASVRKLPEGVWIWDNYPIMVSKDGSGLKAFSDLRKALAYAKKTPGSVVTKGNKTVPLFYRDAPFRVYQRDRFLKEFNQLSEAIQYAKKWDHSQVKRKADQQVVWSSADRFKGFALLNAPVIRQKPQLPRGCEVTSVAMLLQSAGKPLNKMELAEQVMKDPTPPARKRGRIVAWGDPHSGFVGDMYNSAKPGYGVYHEPLQVLVHQHTGGQALDLSGLPFQDVLHFLEKGQPVVVIANARYRPVFDWVYWQGPHGLVRATYHEHSVLVVGYDSRYVYVNDPLSGQKNRKLNRKLFQQAWEQMGRQAVTYLK